MAPRSAVPLSIPKLYNGKNRTFFYAAWEDYKYRSAVETGTLGPTADMRAGDFSALGKTIYDPATTTFDGTTYSRQTFTQEYNEGPGNTSLCNGHINCIPASRIDAISALYESIIPTSGTPGKREQPLCPRKVHGGPALGNASRRSELRQQ